MIRHPIQQIKLRFLFSLAMAVIFICFSFLFWRIEEYLSIFLFYPFQIFLWLVFGISTIMSLTCIWKDKQTGFYAFMPLLINISTFLMLYFVPFTQLWLQIDF